MSGYRQSFIKQMAVKAQMRGVSLNQFINEILNKYAAML